MTDQAGVLAFDFDHPVDAQIDVPVIPVRWILLALLASGVVVAALMARAGLRIALDNSGFARIALALAAMGAVRWWIRHSRTPTHRWLKDFSESVLLFASFSLLGVVASYPVAGATSGFADPMLRNLDQLLHFDWLAWYAAVSANPWLQVAGSAAYASIYVSPFVLLGWYAYAARRADAQRFLATFWVAAVLTLALFPLFPAEGPLAFLWQGPVPYMPTTALYQQQLIPELRARAIQDIDLGALRGLVCAPSFHTVCGVLYMAFAWPVRQVRWFLLPLNAAMLLATPVEGTHYLSDMICGLIVAVVAFVGVRMAVQRLPRRFVPLD